MDTQQLPSDGQESPKAPPEDHKPENVTQEQPEHSEQLLPIKPLPRHAHLWVVGVIIATAALGGVVAGFVIASKSRQPSYHSQNAATATNTANKNQQPIPSKAATTANVWKGTVNRAAIPLGDGNVSSSPRVGYVDSCTTTFKGGGARHAGDWIDTANNTWNNMTKVAVSGAVRWPNATYTITTSGSNRILTTNDLPENYVTGTFPIAMTDPAHQYDSNPNPIGVQNLTYTIPMNPVAAAAPGCTSLGAIGVLSDGVVLFNALDAAGRDAVAHETQDQCDGHPDGQEMYHYHDIPSCLMNAATGSSTLVGYALDGYGIYVERDSKGNLPTNADLDACHGRTSPVMWNGKLTTIYHYDATLEYPYSIGCFHGTANLQRPRP